MAKKYRIKNEDVEKAVRGLFKTQEDFEAQLNLECEKQKHSVYRIFRIAIEPDLCVLNTDSVVSILKSDVEEVVEYDPNGWNEMSVKPPANGQYLVYCKSDKSFSIWCKDGDLWVNPTGFCRRYDNGLLEHFKYRSFDSLKAIELEGEE